MRLFKRPTADNCEGVRELLSPYIDNRTTDAEREAVERHLATCADCRRELSQLQSLVKGLRTIPQVVPTRSFALRPDDLRAPRAAPFAGLLIMRRLAATLAVFLVLLVGMGAFLPTGYGVAPVQAPVASRASQPANDTATGAFTQGAQAPAATEVTALAEKATAGDAQGTSTTAPSAPAAAAPAAGAAQAPAGTPSLAAAPAPLSPEGTPRPEGTPVPAPAAARATTPPGAPAAQSKAVEATPPPARESTAVAQATAEGAATSVSGDGMRDALWTAQLVVALGLLMALIGVFLGRRGPSRL